MRRPLMPWKIRHADAELLRSLRLDQLLSLVMPHLPRGPMQSYRSHLSLHPCPRPRLLLSRFLMARLVASSVLLMTQQKTNHRRSNPLAMVFTISCITGSGFWRSAYRLRRSCQVECGRGLSGIAYKVSNSNYSMFTATCSRSSSAHQQAYEKCSIIHRDVSVGNILILPTIIQTKANVPAVYWTGVLTDWELAKDVTVGFARQSERTVSMKSFRVHLSYMLLMSAML